MSKAIELLRAAAPRLRDQPDEVFPAAQRTALFERITAHRSDEVSQTTATAPPIRRPSAPKPTPSEPHGGRLRFVRRRRLALAVPLSVVALVALMVGIVVVVMPSDQNGGPAGGGTPFVADSLAPTPRVGAGEYAYRVTEYYRVSADGTAQAGGTAAAGGGSGWAEPERQQLWTAPDGEQWQLDTSGGNTQCSHWHGPAHDVGFEEPTQAFFDQMPTNEMQLNDYLRGHVQGSTSQDEAIFVAAADSLRTADLLASSRLRAAWVEVMSHASRITVHSGVRDYLNRPAVRVDFVDQTQRPGELNSLYFDPATFQLLEERDGSSGAPDSFSGPSPAWSGPLPSNEATTTGDELTGPAHVSVVTDEKVVDQLPDAIQNCQ